MAILLVPVPPVEAVEAVVLADALSLMIGATDLRTLVRKA